MRRLATAIPLLLLACTLCSGLVYVRHIDWPSLGRDPAIRAYLSDDYAVRGAHHYTYRNFMDSWELYRFSTSPEAIAFLVQELNLVSAGSVAKFSLIVSRPPPYWWHPERLSRGELFHSGERAGDGYLYSLLYSAETGIAYMIRFDG